MAVCVCVCVCLSVKSHLTSRRSVRPENAVTYSASNEGQKICSVFSETAPLQRSAAPSIDGHTFRRPFFYKVRMRIIVFKDHVSTRAAIFFCEDPEKTLKGGFRELADHGSNESLSTM